MKFSCLLSVYYNESPLFLEQCLFSIWDQQSLKPAQIVLVKDGVLTESLDVLISRWQEKLPDILLVICLSVNLGLARALNIGLRSCTYDLVARMDTDDIAKHDRFLKQLSFMIAHPDIVACSSVVEELDNQGNILSYRYLPLTHSKIVKFAKYRCPLSHPAVIFRKPIVLSVGGYPEFRKGQDYALWSLLIVSGYKLANLPDALVKIRIGADNFRKRGWIAFRSDAKVYYFLRTINFINNFELFFLLLSRFFLSIIPSPLKKLCYKFGR